jgi:lysophospholipase L1-like esterase
MTSLGAFSTLMAGLVLLAAPAAAQESTTVPTRSLGPTASAHACSAPAALMRLAQPLPHVAQRLAKHQPVTIVAIGSSSTSGAGASSPAASYPSRLALELRARFPGDAITVINRGVNGEEVRDMLARFTDGVIKVRPDLVLWQVGTNSVLRDHPMAIMNPAIVEGVRQLRAIGADVVIIDPQYTPRYIGKPTADDMVQLIAAAAKQANVDLFDRYGVMRYWHDTEHMEFAEFTAPDQLHMNDWSYACLAKLIAGSIGEAATRTMASAQATVPATPATLTH